MSNSDRSGSRLLERAESVIDALVPLYPDPRPALDYRNPFELLVATVLSAQCTDAMVNRVTPALFARWSGPESMSAAPLEELEKLIHSTGFFRAKARYLSGLSRMLAERHASVVPFTMEELTALPGVGRKTAGVVLSACWGGDAIIVDTHFGRIARRLGFAGSDDPERTEREIASFLPSGRWTLFSHLLNRHGRAVCIARLPHCSTCAIASYCPSRR
ncbi:MAG: endonuclease III [Treponema sp. GWB1_62_6]|nr:MAG: endonuclease III [Treponema sp. GWA1_62_8]OHE64929.1 MAG: endonuclease III [Treponema sp. GWB1_62_6]OHE67005.1 MAG: endonuclease III [Treponema sp. GWC1_61_84]OHE70917.1 MAG: endonuclease III [Treponema sp. RIFOXYC1_FULL_61_9]HCM27372.1 endonuclease III [Treponema sp.]